MNLIETSGNMWPLGSRVIVLRMPSEAGNSESKICKTVEEVNLYVAELVLAMSAARK